jgi:hypothetical protein
VLTSWRRDGEHVFILGMTMTWRYGVPRCRLLRVLGKTGVINRALQVHALVESLLDRGPGIGQTRYVIDSPGQH